MATIIEQQPLYDILPVGQEVIFTVSNTSLVATQANFKFVARVYVSSNPITLAASTPIGTFKTTPNNAGVGMFDFRNVIENFVSSDNEGQKGSEHKEVVTALGNKPPLHIIDKFSKGKNSFRYFAVEFGIEYLGATDCSGQQNDNVVREQCGEEKLTAEYNLFNGYLKYTDSLDIAFPNFGYSVTRFLALNSESNYLSNAPITQYANDTDYGTISFLNNRIFGVGSTSDISKITLDYFDQSGTAISSEDVPFTSANGGYGSYNSAASNQLLHFGCFPANLRNWSTTFNSALAGNLDYYTITMYSPTGVAIFETITININCPTLKGYEPIRLAWLNQWGAWDYYTFTKKSTKTISTKGSTYRQQEGTWNESVYRINGYKGGKKTFRVNATEKILMNTDFVSEAESEWFEELINSPEVYILNGYDATASVISSLNTYVVPVRLGTSSFTKKTVANDKLIQYTFEIDKSKTLRTQAI